MWVNFESMKRLISPLNVILASIIPTRIFINFLLLHVDHRKMEDILAKVGTVKILNKNTAFFFSFLNCTLLISRLNIFYELIS